MIPGFANSFLSADHRSEIDERICIIDPVGELGRTQSGMLGENEDIFAHVVIVSVPSGHVRSPLVPRNAARE